MFICRMVLEAKREKTSIGNKFNPVVANSVAVDPEDPDAATGAVDAFKQQHIDTSTRNYIDMVRYHENIQRIPAPTVVLPPCIPDDNGACVCVSYFRGGSYC